MFDMLGPKGCATSLVLTKEIKAEVSKHPFYDCVAPKILSSKLELFLSSYPHAAKVNLIDDYGMENEDWELLRGKKIKDLCLQARYIDLAPENQRILSTMPLQSLEISTGTKIVYANSAEFLEGFEQLWDLERLDDHQNFELYEQLRVLRLSNVEFIQPQVFALHRLHTLELKAVMFSSPQENVFLGVRDTLLCLTFEEVRFDEDVVGVSPTQRMTPSDLSVITKMFKPLTKLQRLSLRAPLAVAQHINFEDMAALKELNLQ
jgi:hypothetical protein